jgi:hypothetical protein
LIGKVWALNPDLRLCQLIANCFSHNDLYFVEDEDLYEYIKETYEESFKRKKGSKSKKDEKVKG